MHPDLAALAFLLGTWRGDGRGDYPTIESFEYREEVTFDHVGKPFLSYHQKTWSLTGDPLHTEHGYLRPGGPDGPELVIAQPTGIAEIHVGTLEGSTLDLRARHVVLSPGAVDVTSVARRIDVDGDLLRYRLEMAAVGEPLQFHLEAELRRLT